MDYQKHYDLLVKRGKSRKLEGYKERHHIVPRCMGGSDDASNLVDLTAEEHFLAHQLLVKITRKKNAKLVFALQMMTLNASGGRNNNKRYAWIKKAISENMKVNNPGLKGEDHPLYGKPGIWSGKKRPEHSKAMKGIAKSADHKAKMSIAAKGRPKTTKHCVHCDKDIANPTNFKRWHGDQCKMNPLGVKNPEKRKGGVGERNSSAKLKDCEWNEIEEMLLNHTPIKIINEKFPQVCYTSIQQRRMKMYKSGKITKYW